MTGYFEGKTFILGIGAQRAGTSWLHNYLASRPDVFMSPIKELHYFDWMYRPNLCATFERRFNIRLARKLLRMRAGEKIADRRDIVDLMDRVRMSYDKDAYLEFFKARAPSSARLIGEITPSYSLIDGNGLTRIRRFFEREGMQVKVVYLLRDPVERHYSSLRKREERSKSFSAADSFIGWMNMPGVLERGFYHITLKNLRASFPRSDVHIAFYETFFDHSEVERLCRFLDIDYSVKADLTAKVNEAADGAMTEEMRSLGRQRFAEVYEFCRAEFGDAIPASWNDR